MSHLTSMQSTYDKKKLCTRILSKDDYDVIVKDTYIYYTITDNIVCFFNGIHWNNILLLDMLAYPVLYFDFWSKKDDMYYVNSLIVCPFTMRSMIYKGKIKIQDVINDRLFLLSIDTGDEFFMDFPYTGRKDDTNKEKKIKSYVKRHEVKIMTLKNSYMFLIDPKYIVVKKTKKKNNPLLYSGYYTNKYTHTGFSIYTSFHPKTIVYMVQYYSHTTKNYKYMVLIGKDINKDTVTGYNYKTSGLWSFITKHMDDFIKKKAYIYPVFWFMIDKLYQNVKMILIT